MAKRGLLWVAAGGILALGLWPLGAGAIAPASRIAASMPSGMSLIEQANGVRTSTRATRRTWHRSGPACWYPCHWHGPIKHCASMCR